MRIMKFETPMMRGTDVMDWQRFLKAQTLLADSVDGVFGSNTANASKAFQTRMGIGADGIVGPFTLARALQNGFTSSVEPLRPGMDASVSCTNLAGQIAGAGMKFVVRYYSTSVSKRVSPAEARALSQAGLQLVAVYQDFNNSVDRFNAAIGTEQATQALSQAAAIGQPAGSAIYFACDFDATAAQVRGPIMEYFHAVHDVMNPSPYATGIYGSGLTCRLIRDAGFAKYTWLSQSTGYHEYRAFMAQASLVQAAPARPILNGAVQIDDDIAQASDIGSFQV